MVTYMRYIKEERRFTMTKKKIMFLSISGIEWEQKEYVSEVIVILELYAPYPENKTVTTSIFDSEMTTLMDVLKVHYIDTVKNYKVTAIFEDDILVNIMDVDETVSLWR